MNIDELTKFAKKIRLQALESTVISGRGHLGGTFSCVDLLVALYYGKILNIDPKNPQWEDRDRFILSKGHACLAFFSILLDFGFIDQETFDSYGVDGGLGAQLDITIPGVDWNTGSLGHSLGICSGMALASKIDKKEYYAYTLVGDAECAEGSIWESITFAGDHKLSNLVCIVDRNRLSVTDVLDDDSFFMNYPSVLKSLGWTCFEINGHSFTEILGGFDRAKKSKQPVMIIANTIKGMGVSFMENVVKWHHGVPSPDEAEMAKEELCNG